MFQTRRLLASLCVAASLVCTQGLRAQPCPTPDPSQRERGPARVETQILEFDGVRVEGYGDHQIASLELFEPLAIDGISQVHVDGIQFGLDRSGFGLDGIRVAIELFAGDVPVRSVRVRRSLGNRGGVEARTALSWPIRWLLRSMDAPEGLCVDRLALAIGLDSLEEDPEMKTVAGHFGLVPGADGLRVHAIRGNAPNQEEGRHQARTVEGLSEQTTGAARWDEYTIEPPVETTGLRYIWTSPLGRRSVSDLQPDESGANVEIVLLLEDEVESLLEDGGLRLDDISISGQGDVVPGVFSFQGAHLLAPETRTALAGNQIVGFKWSLRQTGPGFVAVALPNPEGEPSALSFRFFYDDTGEWVRFTRGDPDADDRSNLTDPISILNYLFLDGDAPACMKSADSDDDDKVNITDAIYLLSFLFLGGDPLSVPFPVCGVDPTPDDLGCETPPESCQG